MSLEKNHESKFDGKLKKREKMETTGIVSIWA
jgi:hypothetical protein